MGKDAKGGITVFLSMILLLVLALLLGLLESARVQAARAGCAARADLGLFSLLGEYDRDMLELYDLFFLDGGYGQGTFQSQLVQERLKWYGGAVQEEDGGGNNAGLTLENVQLQGADTVGRQ